VTYEEEQNYDEIKLVNKIRSYILFDGAPFALRVNASKCDMECEFCSLPCDAQIMIQTISSAVNCNLLLIIAGDVHW